jgi:hypothetical protein
MAEKPAEATTSTALAATATVGQAGIVDMILIAVGVSGSEKIARRTLRHREVLKRPIDHVGVFTFDLAGDGRE